MSGRDSSRDGLRNKIEAALLSNLRPLWAFVNRTPWLATLANRLVIDNAVRKVPARPLRLSTMADYTSWNSLSDRTWFARYLPPADPVGLPPLEDVAKLFEVRSDGPVP